MTNFQAAMGLAQLRRIDGILDRKRWVAKEYNNRLTKISSLQLPAELDWAKNVYWMYGVVVNEDALVSRDELAAKLASAGIETRTFFCPMGQQPFLKRSKGLLRETECPVADRLWERGLYLPSAHTLSAEKIDTVCSAIQRVLQA
jgi:perosamine synthetase